MRARTAIVVALILCQVGLGSAAGLRRLTESPAEAPALPHRGVPAASDTAALLNIALTQATAWAPGARLVSEVSWLSWPTSPPDAVETRSPANGWTTFVFALGGDRLALVIDRGSGFILGQHPKSLGLPAAGSLDLSAATVSVETAVMSVEELGGRTYRAACPDHRNQTKVGAAVDAATGALVWVVTYADDRASSTPNVIVAIDAKTGAVVRKEITQSSCDKG